MKNLTVGIFHDEEIGRELGKRGTESDMVMYNRKTDDCIFTYKTPILKHESVYYSKMSNNYGFKYKTTCLATSEFFLHFKY